MQLCTQVRRTYKYRDAFAKYAPSTHLLGDQDRNDGKAGCHSSNQDEPQAHGEPLEACGRGLRLALAQQLDELLEPLATRKVNMRLLVG